MLRSVYVVGVVWCCLLVVRGEELMEELGEFGQDTDTRFKRFPQASGLLYCSCTYRNLCRIYEKLQNYFFIIVYNHKAKLLCVLLISDFC